MKRFLSSIAREYKFTDYAGGPSFDSLKTACQCQFPPEKQIDFEKPLNGTASKGFKHVLIYTGTPASSWPSKLELDAGSLVAEFAMHKRAVLSPMHPVNISNVDLASPVELESGQFLVHLYPENRLFPLTKHQIKPFMQSYLNPTTEAASRTELASFQNSKELILVCGHLQRDIRCGMLAPVLTEQFRECLSTRNLLDSFRVGQISHVGGHAYAGNVLYFDSHGNSIWYGRIFKELVDLIIQQTIVGKKIVKQLYRGVVI